MIDYVKVYLGFIISYSTFELLIPTKRRKVVIPLRSHYNRYRRRVRVQFTFPQEHESISYCFFVILSSMIVYSMRIMRRKWVYFSWFDWSKIWNQLTVLCFCPVIDNLKKQNISKVENSNLVNLSAYLASKRHSYKCILGYIYIVILQIMWKLRCI